MTGRFAMKVDLNLIGIVLMMASMWTHGLLSESLMMAAGMAMVAHYWNHDRKIGVTFLALMIVFSAVLVWQRR
jgi:hypothetical protein